MKTNNAILGSLNGMISYFDPIFKIYVSVCTKEIERDGTEQNKCCNCKTNQKLRHRSVFMIALFLQCQIERDYLLSITNCSGIQ